MQENDYNPFAPKRKRGRPRKAADPRALPPRCCATCARPECTSGLGDGVKKTLTAHACVDYVAPGYRMG